MAPGAPVGGGMPMVPAVKLIALNKEALGAPPAKLKAFGWKRVVLDNSKEGNGQVAKDDLKGIHL